MAARSLVGQGLAGVLPLAPIVAVLVAVAAAGLLTRAPSLTRPIAPGDGLRTAITSVLDAANSAETASGTERESEAALEDAWATLAEALAQLEAQQAVAEGM